MVTPPEVDVNRTTVTLKSDVYVGETVSVNINKYPSYAKKPTVTYTSVNPSIATVDSDGKVTGVAQGATTIIVTVNGKEFTLPVEVFVKADTTTTAFSLSATSQTLYCGTEYDLSELFVATAWRPQTPSNVSLTFFLLNDMAGEMDGTTFTPLVPGQYKLSVIHEASGISQEVTLTCLNSFEIVSNSNSLFVGETCTITILTQQHSNQTYLVDATNIVGVSQSATTITISAIDQGQATISVTPVIGGNALTNLTKTITLSVQHLYTQSFDCQVVEESGEVLTITNGKYYLTMDKTYFICEIVDDETTFYQIRYSASGDVLEIQANGQIVLLSPGSCTLTIRDNASGLSKQIDVVVNNVIELDETPFELTGEDVKENDGSFSIRNGNSTKLVLNFSDNTTFDNVTYSSSDETVATIGQDGMITPQKAGKTIITAVVDDGFLPPLTIQIELTVKRQDAITDLTKFFYQVRKGIGHCGAFLVLGIASTLTWLLFFGKKKMFFSVPLNFVLGFGVATLTEIIQLYVPGRYGSMDDIMLDFSGFSVSAIVITVIFVAIALIKRFKKPNNTKK